VPWLSLRLLGVGCQGSGQIRRDAASDARRDLARPVRVDKMKITRPCPWCHTIITLAASVGIFYAQVHCRKCGGCGPQVPCDQGPEDEIPDGNRQLPKLNSLIVWGCTLPCKGFILEMFRVTFEKYQITRVIIFAFKGGNYEIWRQG